MGPAGERCAQRGAFDLDSGDLRNGDVHLLEPFE
jgi:hypothetical protein